MVQVQLEDLAAARQVLLFYRGKLTHALRGVAQLEERAKPLHCGEALEEGDLEYYAECLRRAKVDSHRQ